MNELEDVVRADARTAMSREVDNWSSFVEAHQEGNGFRRQRDPVLHGGDGRRITRWVALVFVVAAPIGRHQVRAPLGRFLRTGMGLDSGQVQQVAGGKAVVRVIPLSLIATSRCSASSRWT
jgi:hypothetical protein